MTNVHGNGPANDSNVDGASTPEQSVHSRDDRTYADSASRVNAGTSNVKGDVRTMLAMMENERREAAQRHGLPRDAMWGQIEGAAAMEEARREAAMSHGLPEDATWMQIQEADRCDRRQK